MPKKMTPSEIREWARLRQEKAKWILERDKSPKAQREYAEYLKSVKDAVLQAKKELEREKAIDASNLIRATKQKNHPDFKEWVSKRDIPDNRNRRKLDRRGESK